MSALFADVAWEYYIHSRNPAALEFLARLGHYVAADGTYGKAEWRLLAGASSTGGSAPPTTCRG